MPATGLPRIVAIASIPIGCIFCILFCAKTLIDVIDADKKDEIINTIPLGRFGNADDVSELVYFLSSNEAAYITGQTISIDGGLLMY